MNKRRRMMKTRKIRRITLLALIGVILAASVGGTIAWITTKTEPAVNTFVPAEVECEIDEKMSGTTKSSIKVKNTGDTDAYMRVAITGSWCDASGNILAPWDGSVSLASGWQMSGQYYYYANPVAPKAYTGELLASAIQGTPIPDGMPAGTHLVVDVLAQAIQAEPVEAVNSAWHWTPSSN